jgi:hypothetical protein
LKDNIYVRVLCNGRGGDCGKTIAWVGSLFGALVITDNHGHTYRAPIRWAFIEECQENHATRPLSFHPEGQRLRAFPWSAVQGAYEKASSPSHRTIEKVLWGQAEVEAATRAYTGELGVDR